MTGYIMDDATPEEIDAEAATYGPIAETLRQLAESSIRTTVPPEVAAAAVEKLREAQELLNGELGGASYGLKYSSHGIGRPWGNAVVGVRNPVAPPLDLERSPEGVSCEFVLGPQYEGPPTLVHGGVSSLILDQLLGEACASAGSPGMTGTLTIRYRRPTPLGKLRGEANVDRVEGFKTIAVGRLIDAEGNTTVEAEGIFIMPKWAREKADTDPGVVRFD